ncbi:hypothetical protein IWQ60_006558 [Tieghemiomyces parasiticus]|uniref:Autophagy-related protein 16 domain-containing protein n=1 Tax=Tieghemiomyces parasiticus TaxID=78921 RepID=A0A9W8DTL1_9FUNG|nr:hypothetical protein IWQ60_006558 [Tieghemiomyces parasiticus]
MSVDTEYQWQVGLERGLCQRDEAVEGFEALVVSYNTLLHHTLQLEGDYAHLNDTHTTLRTEHAKLADVGAAANLDAFVAAQKRIAELEWQVTTLKDERSDLYKAQGQHAQRLLSLTDDVRRREEQVRDLETSAKATATQMAKLQQSVDDYFYVLREKDGTIQDEMTALQLELVTKEEKLKRVEQENSQLVERWLRKMNEEAERMNDTNRQLEAERRPPPSVDQLNECLGDENYFGLGRRTSDTNQAPSKVPSIVYKELENPHHGEIHTLHVSHDGTMVATGGQDRRVKVFDSRSGNLKYTLSGCLQSVLHVWFSPTDDLILATSSDNAIRVWALDTGRIQHTLTGHIGKVVSAKFDGEARKIISVSHDRTIKSWDLYRGYCSKTIFSISSCNDLCLMDPQGTTILSGHVDNVLRVWDMQSGNCVREVTGLHDAPITSLAIAPAMTDSPPSLIPPILSAAFIPYSVDHTHLLTNAKDGTLHILDLNTFESVGVLRAEGYRPGSNWARAAFSADGHLVAAGSADGVLFIWNTRTFEVQARVKEHTSPVCAAFWDASGQHFFSAEKDQLVCFWE